MSGIDTLGGTCCKSSFIILGTRLTGLPPPLELEELRVMVVGPPLLCCVEDGGGRPVGVANGGADKIDVSEGAEAAKEEIFGLVGGGGGAVATTDTATGCS